MRRPPPGAGDAGRLQHLLENLVSNAIKYTPDGGKVRVDLARDECGRVRVEVRDTGIGIPESAQSRLFTEFFRAPNAKACDAVGTGLGLVIVKEIVEQHGGTLSVESAEGRGTLFTVLLPAATAAAAGPAS